METVPKYTGRWIMIDVSMDNGGQGATIRVKGGVGLGADWSHGGRMTEKGMRLLQALAAEVRNGQG